MSQAGVLLVARNAGRAPCVLPARPRVVFSTARGQPLPVSRGPPGDAHEHAQPAARATSVTLPPGAEARPVLRWVTGAVCDRSRCVVPARVAVRVAGGTRSVAFKGRLCAPAPGPATFRQTLFSTDAAR